MRPAPTTTALLVTLCVLSPAGLTACASTQAARDDISCEEHAQQQHDELRAQLLELRQRDREARAALVEAMEHAAHTPGGGFQLDAEGSEAMNRVNALDTESTAFLLAMIERYGWPTFDMVGQDGAAAAWLLAQHADATPELQQRVLELMGPLVEQGQAQGRLYAMLTDRVLSGRGEPQVYATQFTTDADGVLRPSPTADWAGVAQRRARVGLAPLDEYAQELSELYNQPSSTEPMPVED